MSSLLQVPQIPSYIRLLVQRSLPPDARPTMMQLLAIGAWMFVFYISLFRFKLIPRVLAVIGVIGVTLQFIGVTLMMLLGYRSIGEMAMPLLPIQITVAVWLIVKGFNDPTQSLQPWRPLFSPIVLK